MSRTPLRALRRLFQPDGSRPPRPVEVGVGGAFVDTPLRSSRLRRAGEIVSRGAIHLRLFRAMVASLPDVVHAHDVNTLPTAWAAARRARARLVYDAHEISTDREGYRELRGTIAWAEKRLMPRADATITTTAMRATFFARAYGVPRPLVLQNRPRYADLPRGTRDSRLARARRHRSPLSSTRAGCSRGGGSRTWWRRCPGSRPAISSTSAAAGCSRALEGMVAERGLAAFVHFVPTVPLAELLVWTASADIGVQPIRNTCLNHLSTDSNKLFEYAMAGLPVVASNFPEIPPGSAPPTKSGCSSTPRSPARCRTPLGRLVADADLRVRLARERPRTAPGRSAGRCRRRTSSAFTTGCWPAPRS